MENVNNTTSRRSLLLGGAGLIGAGLFGAANADAAITISGYNGSNHNVIAKARTHIGAPYVFGAKGPNSFDCSGLLQYSARQAGIIIPPGSWQQTYETPRIRPKSGKSYVTTVHKYASYGDVIVLFDKKGRPAHIGLYAGSNNILNARCPGTKVRYDSLPSFASGFSRAQAFCIK